MSHSYSRYLCLLFSAYVMNLTVGATETASPPSSQQRDQPSHVLFTGTEVQIQYGGNLYRVQDLEHGSFIINAGGKEVRIPLETQAEMMRLHTVQRLADRSASVTKFKYDRGYSPANDPHRKFASDINAVHALQETSTYAEHTLRETPEKILDQNPWSATKGQMVPNQSYDTAVQHAQAAGQSISGDMGSTTAHLDRLADELARERFDELNIQFEISSPKPIRAAYVIVTATLHEKDDPKYARNWMCAKPLGAINATPQTISITKDGLPLGFVIDKLQLHLYENGVEIATDLSENRATLSHDEAHEYLMIDYINTHKGATTDPEVALTKAPEDWATHPKAELFKKTYYVKVDKEGHPGDCFEDKSCTVLVTDPYCDQLLKGMLFLPALDKGRPVAGIARVRLIDTTL